MITTLHRSVNHPNAYRWPQEEVIDLQDVDSMHAELRSQIEVLKLTVEQLNQKIFTMVKISHKFVSTSANDCDL